MKLKTLEFSYFSPSSLNSILSCPRRFYYSKIGAPVIETRNKKRDFGSCVHEGIKTYYDNYAKNIPKKEIIERGFLKAIREHWGKYDLKGMEGRRDKCINDLVNFELKRLSNPVLKKAKVYTELKLRNGKRLCIVDFYCGGIAIDWKTGSFEELDQEMIIQGKYTEVLLEKNGYPVKHMLFMVLGTGEFKPLPFITIDIIKGYEKEAWKIIEQGVFPRKKTHLCYWCNHNLTCFFEKGPALLTGDW